jgi:hypothetical protein
MVNSNLPEQFCTKCEGDAVLRKGVTFITGSDGVSKMQHALFSVCLICTYRLEVDSD